MRVGFTLIGGRDWTGGYNYLLNLVRVLRQHEECAIEPVLFVGEDIAAEQIAEFMSLLGHPPRRSPIFDRRLANLRLVRACTLGNVPEASREFRRAGVDVVFEAAQFYGWRFPIPTLAWTPDFQHTHLPHMFSRMQWLRREIGYRAQVASGRILMLSSEHARADSERFYPGSLGRTVVVRFAVLPPRLQSEPGPALLQKYSLPERFLYLPNQFWKHKNHSVVVEALALLRARQPDLVVAASGNPHDTRNVDHYRRLTARIAELGLEDRFRLIGMIPYADVVGLTALCHGLVNPSLFEGWSTTVEEAKSLGAPLVLSSIDVHREQAGEAAVYFDPASPASAAEALEQAWRREDLPPTAERMSVAARESAERVRGFAVAFAGAAQRALETQRAPRPAAAPAAAPSPLTVAPSAFVRRHAVRLKVLLVHNLYRSIAPGGEENVFRQERDLLQEAGVDVVCYTRCNDDVDEHDTAQVLQTAASMTWSRRSYAELAELVRRERPAVAHFHNTFPLISVSGYAACRDNGVPVVQTLHNYRIVCAVATFYRDGQVCELCHAGNPWPAVRHRCYRASAPASFAVAWMLWRNWRGGVYTSLVDRFIVMTQFSASRLAAAGVPPGRILIKPNFVRAPASVGASPSDYAVFAGRLSAEKGLRTLLDAWRELPDVPLKILGDGPLMAEVLQRCRSESLPIEVLGMRPREEVLEIVARARMQVVPSACFEGALPLVAIEAYACGVPVVASRLGSLQEMIDEGRTGLLFKPQDSADLARQVRRLQADEALQAEIRRGTRERYLSMFTPERSLEILLGLYEELSGRSTPLSVAAQQAAALTT